MKMDLDAIQIKCLGLIVKRQSNHLHIIIVLYILVYVLLMLQKPNAF